MLRNPPQSYGAIDPAPQVGFSDEHGIEFNKISYNITSNIQTINSRTTDLENALKVIGTKKDSYDIRNKIHATQLSTNQIVSVITKEFKKFKSFIAKGDKQRRLLVDKLEENFKEALERYSSLQKKIVDKQRSHLLVPSESLDDDFTDENEDVEKQIQIKKTRELAFEQEMLLDRQKRIQELETDIVDVNQIMNDVRAMVYDQGESIDRIADNINDVAENVEAGKNELRNAAKYQFRHNKRLLILVAIAVVCASVLIIVLVVSLKK